MRTGGVTLPAETGQEPVVIELVRRWGADAIRDSDGTALSPALLELAKTVYSTVCLVRADQDFIRAHPEFLPRKFLMSDPVPAASDRVEIDPMAGYFRDKYRLDTGNDPKTYWQVIDRTTGQVVDAAQWDFHPGAGTVVIRGAVAGHVYTVNVLVCQIWDTTSMFNHRINNWTCPHVISTDPYHPAAYAHLMAYFDRWLAEHPRTDVVRLTTLAYHFTVDSGADGSDKYRDWLGYTDTVSPAALEDFAREHGYRLSSEDFVDEGYYHSLERMPTRRWLDWMAFIQGFVRRFGKDLVDRVHASGRKAALFWGDHWAGVEPYEAGCASMGVDIHIGACENGTAVRRLTDAPGTHTRELRLGPYFFPVEAFEPGGDPLKRALPLWVKVRRAMLRRCPDRIGFGGYLSVANRFPRYIDHATALCDEFRQILTRSQAGRSAVLSLRVAVLTAWGASRSWFNESWPGHKFGDADTTDLLENLAGLPVEMHFLSLQEIADAGVPAGVDVIIDAGPAGTAWSGANWWSNPAVAAAVRRWILAGGGFVGIGDPTAHQHQGRLFQLADVLGVQKETGLSVGTLPVPFTPAGEHFIVEDVSALRLGGQRTGAYVCLPDTAVLAATGGHVQLAVRQAGRGRAVYIAALPFTLPNARLLHRGLLWAAGKEALLTRWFCANPLTDCAAYQAAGEVAVVNNASDPQQTAVHDADGRAVQVSLKPYELKWLGVTAWR